MGRPKKKEYWNQVTILRSKAWKCKYCGREFKGGASRIRAHVDRIEGKGIEVCKRSIDRDQQEAVNGMNLGEVAEGGNEIIVANIGGSMGQQTNPESEFINLLGGPVPEQAVNQNYNTAFRSEIDQVSEFIHALTKMEGDIKKELKCLESRGKKRRRQVDDWLNKVRDLKSKLHGLKSDMNDFVYHPDLARQGTQELIDLFNDLQECTIDVKEQKPVVLSKEFVGESFEEHVKKMWELLQDDQVFIIGIHGMGGVGKTCLATHMENEIGRKGAFDRVLRVTVSRDFSILKLQNDIAERIGAKLYGDDESTRAENLSSALLEAKEKSLLILDNVWKNIDLEKVGIPVRMNGIKLILTSRLEHVYYQMNCSSDNIIRMYPLSNEEAWELFLLKLGDHEVTKTFPVETLKIARSVAGECDGLPLALGVMARTMKGVNVNSIYQWRNTMNKLQNSVMGEEMKEEVFEVLKLSYDNLMEKGMQNCFLHCALYDHVDGVDLSMNLFNDGIKSGMRSLTEIFDEGFSILEELEGRSLLLKNRDSPMKFQMNALMRNMAHHILKESHMCMVKCNKGLTKIPHMQEWATDLELISLDNNKIEEIPADLSPLCARLSTLMLSNNSISSIPNCFFTHMNTLAALDLSGNKYLTSLPDSVSDLSSLISLNLRQCVRLKYVPSLEKLQALSTLDISNTSVEEVRGLENLINLKWLDLSFNKQLRWTPGSVLPRLMNLQYLNVSFAGSIKVKVEDVEGMGMLECFRGDFHDCEEYNDYVRTIQKRCDGPKSYLLWTTKPGTFRSAEVFPRDDVYSRTVVFEDCQELLRLLPANITRLKITDNHQWKCLCGTLLAIPPSSLSKIEITSCNQLESLFCSSSCCTLCRNIKNLVSLRLTSLGSLIVIRREDVADNGVFSHLKDFRISFCHGMETLLMPVLLSQLQNLETLSVKSCYSVREIFAVNSSDGDDDGAFSITLPKLTKLKLYDLPLLEVVCKGIIICGSLRTLKIDDCPKLERYPTIQVSSL